MDRDLSGEAIAGRYDLLELIGQGGMGAVYRAYDRELDELVALKMIRSDRSGPAMVESFRHEVKLARRVTHVNIARTFELGFADGEMFCTMELVEGESLRRHLERHGPLSGARAASIAHALCDGLAVAHAAGVIHRDIKPDNILLARDGRVVLADFGVASLTATGDGALSGTLEYMAPEQARGEPAVPATDVYALGLVLYEMLTGMRAFSGTLGEILVAKQELERVTLEPSARGAVPPELCDLVGRTTARELSRRVASARALAELLAPWIGDEHVVAGAPASAPRLLQTIVVFAPRAVGATDALHVAEGVHEELLRQLVTRPRVRVLPRLHGAVVAEDATVVDLTASGTLLRVVIRHGAEIETTLQLALEMRTIRVAADAIAGAVANHGTHTTTRSDAAHELLLRARIAARQSFSGVDDAIALLGRARALAPTDWTIAAELASNLVRFRYATIDEPGIRELVHTVRAAAPQIAASHVAVGYLRLHDGEAVEAAIAFRAAITCSPHTAEGHEGLGRLLLEAGFLSDAIARLEDALAIAPDLTAARWEIARAHALEQNWLVHDKLLAELGWRSFERMRFAWWRGDRGELARLEARTRTEARPGFAPALIQHCFAIAQGDAWARHRDPVLAIVRSSRSHSHRIVALYAQVGAEAASHAGDVTAGLELLERAVNHGLYDLHWLDRCPLLEPLRRAPAWALLRARVEERAVAILDALYGDRTVAG